MKLHSSTSDRFTNHDTLLWTVAQISTALTLFFLLSSVFVKGQSKKDSTEHRKFLIGVSYFNAPYESPFFRGTKTQYTSSGTIANKSFELYTTFGLSLCSIYKRHSITLWPIIGPRVGVFYEGSDYSYLSFGDPDFSSYKFSGVGLSYLYKLNQSRKIDFYTLCSSTLTLYKGSSWGIQEKKQVIQLFPGIGVKFNPWNNFFLCADFSFGIAYHHDLRESPSYRETFNSVFPSGLLNFSVFYTIKK